MSAQILFDGYCKLCNASVQFLQRRQRAGSLSYESLQSDQAKRILKKCGLSATVLETVILVEGGRCYTRSTAALHATRHLRFPWPLLYGLVVVPRFVRDPIYNLVAHNRHRLFGRTSRE
jgi:predicted DCC family thiol-disulfide oxidoreductase YuxK